MKNFCKGMSIEAPKKISRLALGTAQFGLDYGIANTRGRISAEEASEIVNLAASVGVDTIDTAIGYGNSEHLLGEIGVRDFRVISKIPAIPAGAGDVYSWVIHEVEESLKRLKIDCMYGLLMHNSADIRSSYGQAVCDAFSELRRTGKVNKIGVSIYSPNELELIGDIFDYNLIQAPFNLLDQRLLRSGWLSRLKSKGCEVHTRSVFLQGLLLMPRNQIPIKFSNWGAIWDRWHAWLGESNNESASTCLAYPLNFPEIDRVVIGVQDASQFRCAVIAEEHGYGLEFPDINCADEMLINPAMWF